MADIKQIDLNGLILDIKDAQARADIVTINGSLASKVPNTRTVNSKALSSNITLNAVDIPYDNDNSGLSGTNGQSAIDALATRTSHISEATANGELTVNNTYYIQFKDNANSRRFTVAYRSTTAAVRVTGTDVTSGGNLNIYTIALQYGSNTLTVVSVFRTTISSNGTITAPTDYAASLTLENITRIV